MNDDLPKYTSSEIKPGWFFFLSANLKSDKAERGRDMIIMKD
jgi:hypothetical protein